MSSYISATLREQIIQTDRKRCCYCQTQELNSGIPLSFDHILPRSQGGETSFENVCLACRPCNEFKAASTEGIDPLTGVSVSLFNPRFQHWGEHFAWSDDGITVEGLTPIGRATVVILRMNHTAIVTARKRWSYSGWHPPTD
ncbi:HNH endonuclease [Leptolyngbya cf. ectocarpi LEGE 11479]|uniref:HNH endonuclease n=1 Tax=Leptolyngbya cf. ectocarpi LEGE 11479 TaxID=1828722 RepID=A0A928ZU79_LEPEC|nr:HNH endonuclease [Leptolyngbya ectocarpi]MBE9067533.1 HNH endonuclease [Leptolyngbya cf. ectocarpi LEGE 11479]